MADEDQRNYHIGYARAVFGSLFDDLDGALEESWKAGTSITRYGRRWHLTKILDRTSELYFGQIGFVTDHEVSTLHFDQKAQIFVYGDAPSGYVVPFAIRKSDGVIAYQLYPGVVRETTFTGALTDLLNNASDNYIWHIESFVEIREFGQWLEETPAITRFDLTLERPNPNYAGRPRVEEMVEDVKLETLRLVGKVIEGETVNLDADYFREALDHVIYHEYGKAKLRGIDHNGEESVWEKIRGVVGRVASQRSYRAVGPDEVPEAVLVTAIGDAPTNANVELAEPFVDGDET